MSYVGATGVWGRIAERVSLLTRLSLPLVILADTFRFSVENMEALLFTSSVAQKYPLLRLAFTNFRMDHLTFVLV